MPTPTSTEAHSIILHYFNNCGYLTPSTTDIKSWTALTLPTSVATDANASVGLFGYDITCLASMCAEKSDYANYCSFLVGSGIDGWSLGVKAHWVSVNIILGQSNAITGDAIHEETKLGFMDTCSVLTGNYSIVATGTGVTVAEVALTAQLGFSKFCLYESLPFGWDVATFINVSAKFQHGDENQADGAQW